MVAFIDNLKADFQSVSLLGKVRAGYNSTTGEHRKENHTHFSLFFSNPDKKVPTTNKYHNIIGCA